MLKFTVDISEIVEMEKATNELLVKVERSLKGLVAQTHAHIIEEAKIKLKTRLNPFLENLTDPEEVSDGIYVITLKEPGLWVEEGQPEGDMIDHFLKSAKAKQGANGKYLRIPFKHGDQTTKGLSERVRTPLQATLADTIKNELKILKIPSEIQMDQNGKPKLGMVHKMDIKSISPSDRAKLNLYSDKRITSGTINKQSHSARSYLKGVIIFQKLNKLTDAKGQVQKDESGNDKTVVKKEIVTIRTISESQKGKGMWHYPGIEGEKFLDEALDWCTREWETKIKKEILKSL